MGKIFFIILILVVLDQVIKCIMINNITSKKIIDGILNFTYIENTGGAYGIGSNNIKLIIIFNILIIASALGFIILKRCKLDRKIIIGLTLIIAGGMGNLTDRIFRGYVVDYIDINPLIKYPIFNLADIFIVLGSVILAIGVILSEKKEK